MAYLKHDNPETATVLKNQQILGEDSPLEFDEDGYAGPVDDEDATMLAALHRHVEVASPPPTDDEETDADEEEPDEEADAEDESDAVELLFDPGEHTIEELEDAVADIDDPDVLEALREAEADGKNRDGAHEVLNDQLTAGDS